MSRRDLREEEEVQVASWQTWPSWADREIYARSFEGSSMHFGPMTVRNIIQLLHEIISFEQFVPSCMGCMP